MDRFLAFLRAEGLLLTGMLLPGGAASAQTIAYPAARRSDVVDDYHGTKVPDPYRWLEDPDSPETRTWIDAENRVTTAYLKGIPQRERILRRLTQLWDYPKFGAPFHRGGHYFFFKNDGLQNQAVLYEQATLTAEPQVLLDPNLLSEDGTVALSTLAVSEDGALVAYGTSASGSDWEEFHVRDVASGTDRPDHLRWIKFSGASWTHDGKGLFYSRYPEPTGSDALRAVNRFQKLYFHRLGTDQAADVLVYEQPDQPDWGVNGTVTDDGRYLILTVWLGTDRRNRVYWLDLQDAQRPRVQGEVVRMLDAFDASYSFVGNDGPVFYVLTDLDAPRKRVVAIDTRQPDRAHWREIIPQGEDVIDAVQIIHDRFVVNSLHDAHSRLRVFALDGKLEREITLPALGTVTTIAGERRDSEMFYAFTSILYPTTILRFDFPTATTSVFKAPKLDFDPSRYETKQVFYTSKDGTRVPMFITHRKGIALDGSHPTYLYGYGGFNISLTPTLSVGLLVWLEMGGVCAIPSLRGGGEYGEEWHQAGMHEKKQNVFDDFIAAAEYLIARKYTSPNKLAMGGGSNGGLLVGAAMTQRPELFAAAVPAVGVFDMLRFHQFTIGWAWVAEYGSADSASQFPYLHAYSPLHRLVPGTHYPATLITTADHDDRVVPGHSFKFAAALQAAQGGQRPVLIEIETKAGHGAGKPTRKVIEEQADRWAFLVKILEMKGP